MLSRTISMHRMTVLLPQIEETLHSDHSHPQRDPRCCPEASLEESVSRSHGISPTDSAFRKHAHVGAIRVARYRLQYLSVQICINDHSMGAR